jgi:hypothetical protein
VPTADIGGGLVSFGVIAEPDERCGAAAVQAGRIVAHVPEQERDRHAAQFARDGEAL